MSATSNESLLLGQFIPLHYHYQMLLDKARMTGFRDAIHRMVPQGGKVLELGGGTGVLSFFAAQKASRVWCVERNPEMVEAARYFLTLNGCADKVQVISADATTYQPPEPVDVVICEMLHSALLREKQLEVIAAFKRNYLDRFPGALPRFIPDATLLAVQPVQQVFDFYGYKAPLPMFYQPTVEQTETIGLGDPQVYTVIEYRKEFATTYQFNGQIQITQPGTLNALRFITKNILAILLDTNATIDWHNFYLIIPLRSEIPVQPGQTIQLEFSYQAGEPIETLTNSIRLSRK